jgi:hypothetical protein
MLKAVTYILLWTSSQPEAATRSIKSSKDIGGVVVWSSLIGRFSYDDDLRRQAHVFRVILLAWHDDNNVGIYLIVNAL